MRSLWDPEKGSIFAFAPHGWWVGGVQFRAPAVKAPREDEPIDTHYESYEKTV